MPADPGSPNPYVSLLFSDLQPGALQQLDRRSLGTIDEQIAGALSSYRLLVINQVKKELIEQKEITGASLMRMVDMASEIYLGRFTKLVGPAAIQAYTRAYRNANAGDIPMSTLYALAEQHSARMGTYFHQTSKEAMAEGFTQYLNRRVVTKAAAERALEGYGLTRRQMYAYVALADPQKVTSATPRPLKAQVREYITRSIQQRFKVFAKQEAHNLDQQAQQLAWTWLQDKGKITGEAEKVWLTARDERTCPQCAPMHGKKAHVDDQFELPNGTKVYVPGVHPNCRCEVRLVDPGRLQIEYGEPETEIEKADRWDPREHPRGGNPRNRGQFSRVSARQRQRMAEPEPLVFPRPAAVRERETRPIIEPAAVIEEAPAPVKEERLVLEKPKLRLERSTTRPSLRIGEPLRLEKEEQLTLAKPEPTSEVLQLRLESTQPRLSLSTKPQLSLSETPQRLRLEVPAKPDFKPLKPAPPPEPLPPPPDPTTKMPEPSYKVLSPDELNTSGTYLFGGDRFDIKNVKAAAYSAAQFRNQLIDIKYRELVEGTDEDYVTMRIFDPHDGVYHQGRISKGDLHSVLKGMALYEDGDDNVKNQQIPIKMYDYDQQWVKSQNFALMDVAESLEVHAGDFKVVVLEVTHAHNPEAKQGGFDYDPGSRHGDTEGYYFSGAFSASDERDEYELGHRINIVTVSPITSSLEDALRNHSDD